MNFVDKCSIAIAHKWLSSDGVRFVLCPKQGINIEDVVLNRVCILGFFCPKHGQGFKPSQRLYYIPILVEYPSPSLLHQGVAVQQMLRKCCSVYLATLGAGVASSCQAIRQFRNEQETGPELTFAKTSGTKTTGQDRWRGGGENLPKRLSLLVALAFKS